MAVTSGKNALRLLKGALNMASATTAFNFTSPVRSDFNALVPGSVLATAEADTARTGLTLVQASIDGTVPPMPFNQIQCADLKGWDGQVSAPGWGKLLARIYPNRQRVRLQPMAAR